MTDDPILPLLQRAVSAEAARAAGWRLDSERATSPLWIVVRNERSVLPQQGWKIHVSASIPSAEEVLRRSLPVLLSECASFKVAASLNVLADLNNGEGGLGQIGKFITVYPEDEDQAVRFADALHTATHGLRAPTIPSDRPLVPGSLVHYRYGGFRDQQIQSALGEILPVLRAPSGELLPDRRDGQYHCPQWTSDPFLSAGIAVEPSRPSLLIENRFLVTGKLHQSPRGAVFMAADTLESRCCVLKVAERDAVLGPNGEDARDEVRREADILAPLASDGRFPQVYDLLEREDDTILVMEHLAGETLQEYVAERVRQGRLPSQTEVSSWGRAVASLIEVLHARGLVHRDLKPSNVIMTPDGLLRLVDFGLARPAGTKLNGGRGGSRGSMSPQQRAGARPTVADDVYGLGSLLYFAATGADPSLAPRPYALMNRPPSILNPHIDAPLEAVLDRCLHVDAERRYESIAAVREALAAAGQHCKSNVKTTLAHAAPPGGVRWADYARRLGDSLCRAAQSTPDGQGLKWPSTHSFGKRIWARDLATGSAGVVLTLAELVFAFGDEEHRRVLAEGAHGLLAPRPHEGPPLPGLYVGEAGIAAALLRAGQALNEEHLIAAAEERGRAVAALPYTSPDLYNGTAGRLRFHLLLWDCTGDAVHLRHAVEAGEALRHAATPRACGGIEWVIPSGYESLSGQAWLGYAHGTAGIADALLDLFDATGDERWGTLAQSASEALEEQAIPVLEDDLGLDWPMAEGGAPVGPFWCHGAAGVGRFFLHAGRSHVASHGVDLACRAAKAVVTCTRGANPTQCHGLAGNLEFLLDLYRFTEDEAYLRDAQTLARCLEAFAAERDGMLLWPSEHPETFTPEYMGGYAGVALCLLRLAAPNRMPDQLSRAGFQFRTSPRQKS